MSDDEMLWVRGIGLMMLVLASFLVGTGAANLVIWLGWLP